MKVDWLIVGTGFTGAVLAERIASQLHQKVPVLDRRDHIGGNAHDQCDEHGILVHKFGSSVGNCSTFTWANPVKTTFLKGLLVRILRRARQQDERIYESRV